MFGLPENLSGIPLPTGNVDAYIRGCVICTEHHPCHHIGAGQARSEVTGPDHQRRSYSKRGRCVRRASTVSRLDRGGKSVFWPCCKKVMLLAMFAMLLTSPALAKGQRIADAETKAMVAKTPVEPIRPKAFLEFVVGPLVTVRKVGDFERKSIKDPCACGGGMPALRPGGTLGNLQRFHGRALASISWPLVQSTSRRFGLGGFH